MGLNAYAASPLKDTNAFFKGFEDACEHPKAFDRYYSEVCEYVQNDAGEPSCKLNEAAFKNLPKHFQVATTEVKVFQDSSNITVMLKPGVVWRGLPVKGIITMHGHENGLVGANVIVDTENFMDVFPVMTKNGAKFRSKPVADQSWELGAHVASRAGSIRLTCHYNM